MSAASGLGVEDIDLGVLVPSPSLLAGSNTDFSSADGFVDDSAGFSSLGVFFSSLDVFAAFGFFFFAFLSGELSISINPAGLLSLEVFLTGSDSFTSAGFGTSSNFLLSVITGLETSTFSALVSAFAFAESLLAVSLLSLTGAESSGLATSEDVSFSAESLSIESRTAFLNFFFFFFTGSGAGTSAAERFH